MDEAHPRHRLSRDPRRADLFQVVDQIREVALDQPGSAPAQDNLAQGRDAQMTKALEVLRADVEEWKKRPQPKLKLSTDRP